MPIYPYPPELQAIVSGSNLHPTIGAGLTAYTQSLREEQAGSRTMLDAIGRQTPGFMQYLTANHPDIIEEMTGPPRIFRGKGEQPLSSRLQAAMQAFQAQPGPAEAPLTGEQTVQMNEHVQGMLNSDPRIRTLPPEAQAHAGLLLRHMTVATNPDDIARTRAAFEQFLGGKPSEMMQKFMDATQMLGSGQFGDLPEDYKARKAAEIATGTAVQSRDDLLLDKMIKNQTLKNAQLEEIRKQQEITQAEILKENGKPLPVEDTRFLGDIEWVLNHTNKLMTLLKTAKFPLETTAGAIIHAQKFSEDASSLAAELSIFSEAHLRFSLQLPGRVSEGLLELLKYATAPYDKTVPELKGIVRTVRDSMISEYDSRLHALEMGGYGSPKGFAKFESRIDPYRKAAEEDAAATKARRLLAPAAPSGTVKQSVGRLFGGPAPKPTEEQPLFGETP